LGLGVNNPSPGKEETGVLRNVKQCFNLGGSCSHFRNPTECYRIWIVTLCISSNVTEKENYDYVPFLNRFLFLD
jgi:hypothetical protein